MAKRLMVGDPRRPKGLIEWVYGRKFQKKQIGSMRTRSSELPMVPELDSELTTSAGPQRSTKLFQPSLS